MSTKGGEKTLKIGTSVDTKDLAKLQEGFKKITTAARDLQVKITGLTASFKDMDSKVVKNIDNIDKKIKALGVTFGAQQRIISQFSGAMNTMGRTNPLGSNGTVIGGRGPTGTMITGGNNQLAAVFTPLAARLGQLIQILQQNAGTPNNLAPGGGGPGGPGGGGPGGPGGGGPGGPGGGGPGGPGGGGPGGPGGGGPGGPGGGGPGGPGGGKNYGRVSPLARGMMGLTGGMQSIANFANEVKTAPIASMVASRSLHGGMYQRLAGGDVSDALSIYNMKLHGLDAYQEFGGQGWSKFKDAAGAVGGAIGATALAGPVAGIAAAIGGPGNIAQKYAFGDYDREEVERVKQGYSMVPGTKPIEAYSLNAYLAKSPAMNSANKRLRGGSMEAAGAGSWQGMSFEESLGFYTGGANKYGSRMMMNTYDKNGVNRDKATLAAEEDATNELQQRRKLYNEGVAGVAARPPSGAGIPQTFLGFDTSWMYNKDSLAETISVKPPERDADYEQKRDEYWQTKYGKHKANSLGLGQRALNLHAYGFDKEQMTGLMGDMAAYGSGSRGERLDKSEGILKNAIEQGFKSGMTDVQTLEAFSSAITAGFRGSQQGATDYGNFLRSGFNQDTTRQEIEQRAKGFKDVGQITAGSGIISNRVGAALKDVMPNMPTLAFSVLSQATPEEIMRGGPEIEAALNMLPEDKRASVKKAAQDAAKSGLTDFAGMAGAKTPAEKAIFIKRMMSAGSGMDYNALESALTAWDAPPGDPSKDKKGSAFAEKGGIGKQGDAGAMHLARLTMEAMNKAMDVATQEKFQKVLENTTTLMEAMAKIEEQKIKGIKDIMEKLANASPTGPTR